MKAMIATNVVQFLELNEYFSFYRQTKTRQYLYRNICSFYSSAFEHTHSIKAIERSTSVFIYVKINVHYIKVDKIVIVME